MFKNYLTIAIRNLARYKVYSFINIAGLAIGMACCALIMLYVQYELSYDVFHSKGDRIYRVLRETRGEDGTVKFNPGISGAFAPALMNDFPEVEHAVRTIGPGEYWTRYEGKRLFQERISWIGVEPDFFTVFDFPFVQGDPKTALRDPGSMVISERAAKRYFGSENPMGKVITAEVGGDLGNYKLVVAGVVKVPKNTVLRFDMAAHASLSTNDDWQKGRWEGWDANYHARPFQAYVLLHEGVEAKALEAKLPDFMERYMGSEIRANNTYHLQPVKRIHLYTYADYEGDIVSVIWMYPYGDIQNVYLFSGIALLILMIACVNFMNLATARSANRAKEVGLRKVSGAYRFQLIRQFLGEAILLSFVACVLALGLVELTLPKFSAFVGHDLTPQRHIAHFIIVPAIVAFIGLLAGCYPAFFLSAFEPVSVLTGYVKTGLRGVLIRKGLVIFQFAMSILLIIGTVTVYRQLSFMQDKRLGFDKEFVINLPFFRESGWSNDERAARYETVKQAFLAHPDIQKATAYRWNMGSGRGGLEREYSTESGDVYQMLEQEVDRDFVDTFGIELIAGRNFSDGDAWVKKQEGPHAGVILNETAVKLLGWEDPIGKQVFTRPVSTLHVRTVIGVMKDYHSQSLHKEIEPQILLYRKIYYTLGLKLKGDKLPETIAFMEKTWKQFVPDRPFQFAFLDESLNQLYREEMRTGQLVGTFSLLAILVACLGLFGLAAYTAEQRTKEIGVRKVLGASVKGIVLLLSKEFAKLVLIANVIAWPVAYFAVGDWLQNFAYRVDVVWWVFALAGMVALLIALVTVGYQALRAAVANPIEALRYE